MFFNLKASDIFFIPAPSTGVGAMVLVFVSPRTYNYPFTLLLFTPLLNYYGRAIISW